MAKTLESLGFQSTQADLDIYHRRAKKSNGMEYHKILLVYVDDIMIVSHEPQVMIDKIGEIYEIKEGSSRPPEMYLGAQTYQHPLPDGRSAWVMFSETTQSI